MMRETKRNYALSVSLNCEWRTNISLSRSNIFVSDFGLWPRFNKYSSFLYFPLFQFYANEYFGILLRYFFAIRFFVWFLSSFVVHTTFIRNPISVDSPSIEVCNSCVLPLPCVTLLQYIFYYYFNINRFEYNSIGRYMTRCTHTLIRMNLGFRHRMLLSIKQNHWTLTQVNGETSPNASIGWSQKQKNVLIKCDKRREWREYNGFYACLCEHMHAAAMCFVFEHILCHTHTHIT